MGIPGLLVALKSYFSSDQQQSPNDNNNHYQYYRTGNIYTDFRHESIVIDASSWFHKSVYSIADHYVECVESQQRLQQQQQQRQQQQHQIVLDDKCIETSTKYMITRLYELLQQGQIQQIYLVLDGQRCPLKCHTNTERNDKRQRALSLARKYKQQQQHEKSNEQYKSCIKIINELSYTVAAIIHRHFATSISMQGRVEIVYSPYEADAQLVQICRQRMAQAIVTEDSDVLLYCATCNVAVPIVYKLHRATGDYEMLSMGWLLHPITTNTVIGTTHSAAVKQNQPPIPTHHQQQKGGSKTMHAIFDIFVGRQIQHPGWGIRLFVQACILAGCDYTVVVDNTNSKLIPGMGLINAFKYIQMAGLHLHQQQQQQMKIQTQQDQCNVNVSNSNHPKNLAFDLLDTIYEYILTKLLPLKHRRLIQHTIKDIELILHKSECIFYYHPVRVTAGTTTTIQYLNHLSNDTTSSNTNLYQPSVRRYQDDLSFIGSFQQHNDDDNNNNNTIGRQQHHEIIPSHILHPKNDTTINHRSRTTNAITIVASNHHKKSNTITIHNSSNNNKNNRITSYDNHIHNKQTETIVDDLSTLSGQDFGMGNEIDNNNANKENRPPPPPPRPITINPYFKQQQAQILNPFDKYAFRHRQVGQLVRTNQIVTAKLPVRSQQQQQQQQPHSYGKSIPSIKNQQQSMLWHYQQRQSLTDVRFVKRTDYNDETRQKIDDRQQIHIPREIQNEQRVLIHQPNRIDAVGDKHPIEHQITSNRTTSKASKPLVKVPSKYFTNRPHPLPLNDATTIQQETRQEQLFCIREECPVNSHHQPGVTTSKSTDSIVSLQDFDPCKAKTTNSNVNDLSILQVPSFYEIIDYEDDVVDTTIESPRVEPTTFRNDTLFGNSGYGNYHRRVTLDVADESATRTSNRVNDPNKNEPSTFMKRRSMHFNFYDEEMYHASSPSKVNTASSDKGLTEDVDGAVTIDKVNSVVKTNTIHPKTKHFRLGSPHVQSSSIKKVVKRGTNTIKRFFQKQQSKRVSK